MSIQAEQQRTLREQWATPGGRHDRIILFLKTALPTAVLIITFAMLLAPFTNGNEVSFVLDKNTVEVASERLKVREAVYRGRDTQNRPFMLRAGSAVQKSSKDPYVDLRDLSAQIQMKNGPATLNAKNGRYDIDRDLVGIVGPVQFRAADGYQIKTNDVGIDLKSKRMESHAHVTGSTPLGTFSADKLQGDMNARTLTLNGRARLIITQNGLKGHTR